MHLSTTMNPKAWFSSLVTKNVVIAEPGEYITRGGEKVAIIKASSNHDFGCRGKYATGQRDNWHKSGHVFFSKESVNDIVSKI